MNTQQSLWDEKHTRYSAATWINKPTVFAEEILPFFPQTGKLLELGCGQGQDSRFFAEKGYEVTALDFSAEGLKFAREKLPSELKSKVVFKHADISKTLPFENASFDVVYSHLALHYFDRETTTEIFSEIHRVLKPGGTLALIVNSVGDPEYGTGEKIEDDFMIIGGLRKRYFSAQSLCGFTRAFKTILLDERGKTHKDRAAANNSCLVRFVGKKVSHS